MDETLEILVKLKDLASAGLKTVGADVGNLEHKVNATNFGGFTKASGGLKADAEKAAGDAKGGGGGIGSLIGSMSAMAGPAAMVVGSALAVAAAVGEVTSAAEDDQSSQAGLQAALRANVDGWSGSAKAIEQYIGQAEQASAFTKDDLRTSLESLVGATGDVTKAETLQATATNLARYAHISLSDATSDVIKVNEGVYKSLAPLGIKISATTDSMTALAKVNKLVAGQDTSYLNTEAGQMQLLGDNVHDLEVEVGDKLLPVFQSTLKFVNANLIPAMGALGAVWDSTLNTLTLGASKDLELYNDAQAAGARGFGGLLPKVIGKETDDTAVAMGLLAGTITSGGAGVHTAITGVQTDIADGWGGLETQVMGLVTATGKKATAAQIKAGKAFQGAIKGAYTTALDLSPTIIPDSTRLQLLYKQLATAEANRDSALKRHDSVSLQTDDKDIAALTAEINALVAANSTNVGTTYGNKRAAGGYLSAGDWVVGEGGSGQGEERVHLNPGSSGWVGPSTGPAGGGRGAIHLTVNINSIWPPSKQHAREIAELVNHELGLRLALSGGSTMFSGG